MCLAQGHNAVTPVRLKPASPPSQVKHSTTEPLCKIMYMQQYSGARGLSLHITLKALVRLRVYAGLSCDLAAHKSYSKTCLKRPLKNRQNKDLYDKC